MTQVDTKLRDYEEKLSQVLMELTDGKRSIKSAAMILGKGITDAAKEMGHDESESRFLVNRIYVHIKNLL